MRGDQRLQPDPPQPLRRMGAIDAQFAADFGLDPQSCRAGWANPQAVIAIRHGIEQDIAIKIAGGLAQHLPGPIDQLNGHAFARLAIGAQQHGLDFPGWRKAKADLGRDAGPRDDHHALHFGL